MKQPRAVAATVGSALLLTGCSFGPPDDPDLSPPRLPEPSSSEEPRPEPGSSEIHSVLASDLEIPWDLDFLPDGGALVSERASGRVLKVGPESDTTGLRVREVYTLEVNSAGEGGLLGIAVSPEYERDGWVYVYHSTESDNRIVRFQLPEPARDHDGGQSAPSPEPTSEPEPILTGIPHSESHNGGRLAFGPDGYLYATTGDADEPDRAQDPDDLAGGVLRMTLDGDPAPDNPSGGHTFAYGLRNPQGLSWDGADRLWATDFGEDDHDEVNLIQPGGNYGWPRCEGDCEPGEESGTGEDTDAAEEDDELIDPVVTWRPFEASCSGIAAQGATVATACLRGQRLWLFEVTATDTILGAPRPVLSEVYGRLRAVTVAPDGSLWVTTSNRDGRLPGGARDDDDRIIRLVVSTAGAGGIT